MTTAPSAIIIGSARASTTSLFYALGEHPDIYPLSDKEPNRFIFSGPEQGILRHALPSNRGQIETRSVKSDEEYARLLSGRKNETVTLEASPAYLHLPGVERNIRQHAPDAKLIVVKRDRVDLLLSMYSALLKLPFSEFEEYLFNTEKNEERDCLIMYSNIDMHIQRYKNSFDSKQIFISHFDDLMREGTAEIRNICGFLNVSTEPDLKLPNFNASGKFKTGITGSAMAAFDARKETFRALVPTRIKQSILPIYHGLRNRARSREDFIDQRLRSRIECELFASSAGRERLR